jgi:hydrogenase maturation protein HypF
LPTILHESIQLETSTPQTLTSRWPPNPYRHRYGRCHPLPQQGANVRINARITAWGNVYTGDWGWMTDRPDRADGGSEGGAAPGAEGPDAIAQEIRVQGIVQGVGFRPTVYHLAMQYRLRGWVLNDGAGVLIRVAGPEIAVNDFVAHLQAAPPPLAHMTQIQRSPIPLSAVPDPGFTIATSQSTLVSTHISPDAATCPQCLADLQNPASRFFQYPFVNCTHCGPRLSIIRGLPYDRPQTSMAAFPPCDACDRDYHDIANRRFHAQPIACPRCGPQVWLEMTQGKVVAQGQAAIAQAVQALQAGKIVAIKGLGGIHLACDATQPLAVATLRQRKHRPHKPLALMARDVAQIRAYCPVTPEEQRLLESPAAPIVLLPQRSGAPNLAPSLAPSLAPNLAPGVTHLGFMLPYTPLHHLILAQCDRPMVLTSGNPAGEPQCIDNEVARQRLDAIADYWLLHDRAIVNRVDDSVVRVVDGSVQVLRRARGYAPAALALPPGFEAAPPLVALGSDLKNTACFLRHGSAILTQHLGDLNQAPALTAYAETLTLYQRLFDHSPQAIALDAHPDYHTTHWGQRWAAAQGLPVYTIQHHHAHIAAILAEHGYPLEGPPVLGIALDGLGYGDGDDFWGGEWLWADYTHATRLAHLPPRVLLGGSQAMRQPWRNAYAHLRALWTWDELLEHYGDIPSIQALAQRPRSLLDQLLATQLRSPLATSAGRLFDAVAAVVGCTEDAVSYEGQAAMALEALIHPEDWATAVPYSLPIVECTPATVDYRPFWAALLRDRQTGIPPGQIAARFHYGLAQAIAQMTQHLAQHHGFTTVALGGGVFQNRILLTAVAQQLTQQGLTVLTNHQVPSNDGGLSLGQGAIAAARWIRGIPPSLD